MTYLKTNKCYTLEVYGEIAFQNVKYYVWKKHKNIS